jgi:hypothetical protein
MLSTPASEYSESGLVRQAARGVGGSKRMFIRDVVRDVYLGRALPPSTTKRQLPSRWRFHTVRYFE